MILGKKGNNVDINLKNPKNKYLFIIYDIKIR